MTKLNRRAVLQGLGAGLGLGAASGCVTPLIDTVFRRERDDHPPVGTRSFVSRCFDGLDRRRLWDSHVHVIGNGRSGSGCYVHPDYRDTFVKSALYDVYIAAGGMSDSDNAEASYLEYLVKLHRLANAPGRMVCLAFDCVVDEEGKEHPEATQFFTPNAWVEKFAARFHDVLFAASIHPYRKDAVDRLDQAYEAGAVAVKWLPNAQVIDPSSDKCDPFYKRAAELQIPLIVHAGHEAAADSAGTQGLGNVLRLRRALDSGCRVVVAHCAGLGSDDDIEASDKHEMESYELFRRLLDDKSYDGRIFADISAMTQFNRTGRALDETVRDVEIHPKLINGSDFPLPAIRFLVSAQWLERFGYLTKAERIHCERVFEVNPLLYDFVVKRSLRVRDGAVEHRFSDVVFDSARVFEHLPGAQRASSSAG